MQTEQKADPSDILWGSSAIAKAIGRTERQTFHMLSSGELSAKKVGGRWCASRTKLYDFLLGDAA